MAEPTYTSAGVNLINSVIGAGVLALPFSLKTAGLVLGLILLTFVCLISALSLHLLHLSCRATGTRTFYDLALHVGSQKFVFATKFLLTCAAFRLATLVEVVSMFYLFGALVSYIVIIADMIHSVASECVALFFRVFISSAYLGGN